MIHKTAIVDENAKISENVKYKTEIAKSKPYLDITEISLLTGYSISTIRRAIDDSSLVATQTSKNSKYHPLLTQCTKTK